MPTLSVDFTAAQAARIAAALGPIPVAGEPPVPTMTPQAWVEFNIKAWLKSRVISHEQQVAANAAYDAARVQAEADFA